MKKEIFYNYATRIAKHFDLSQEEMFSKTKKREIVDARQVLYYVCLKRPMRVASIRRYMEEMGYVVGHSTIIHGANAVEKMIKEDKDFNKIVNVLT